MNLQGKRIIYLLLIVLFLGVIVTSVYYLLGGFEKVEVYQLNPINRTVVGKQFDTHYTDEAPIEFGKYCRSLIEQGDIEGILTIINYQPDTLSPKQTSRFIGISLKEDMAEIPQGFEIREMVSEERFAVFLSMHVLVQPRPHTIEKMLREKAAASGFELDDFFVELRYLDNSLSVEGWVKK